MAAKPIPRSKKKKARPTPLVELSFSALSMHIYLVLMLGVFALFTLHGSYTRVSASKNGFLSYTTYTMVLAMLGLFIFTLVQNRTTLFNKEGPLLGALRGLSVSDYAVLAFLLIGFVSMLASRDIGLAFGGSESRNEGYHTLLLYGFIYFAVSRFYSHRTSLLMVFAVSASILSLIGILQFYGFDWLALSASAPSASQPFGRAAALTTLGNVNLVSAYLCFVIPLFAVLYIKTENRLRFVYLAAALLCWYLELCARSDSGFIGLGVAFVLLLPFLVSDLQALKRLFIVVAGVAFVGFLFSVLAADLVVQYIDGFSRMVFLLGWKLLLVLFAALICAAAIHYFFEKRFHPGEKVLRRAAAAITIVCVVGALLVGWFYQAPPDSGFLYEYTQAMRGNMSDSFGTSRGFIWTRSLALFEMQPITQKLIGVGPGMFADAFDPVFGEESIAITGSHYDRAHNEYLHTLVTMGILGLLCYLIVLACVFIRAWKHRTSPVALALGASLICFYIQAFFNISSMVVTPFFWIILGLFMARTKRAE